MALRTPTLRFLAACALLVGVGASRTALAASDEAARFEGTFHIAGIEEDLFAGIDPGVVLHFPGVRLALHVPVRFRIADRSPHQDDPLRRQEWDEPGDVFRPLRALDVRAVRGRLRLHAGELDGVSLGHGTVVDRYWNVLDPDHYRFGITARYDAGSWGGELVASVAWPISLAAARVYARPLVASRRLSRWLRTLEVGGFLAVDPTAPAALQPDGHGGIALDATGPRAASTRAAWLYGADVAVTPLDNRYARIRPYFDVAAYRDQGIGTFAGLFVRLPFAGKVRADVRAEWRWASAHFEGSWFGPLYEMERSALGSLPKVAAVETAGRRARHGFLLALDVGRDDGPRAGVVWEDAQGADNQHLMVYAETGAIGPVSASATWIRRNFDTVRNLFDVDQTYVVAAARLVVWGPVIVRGGYARQWHVGDNGRWHTTDDWSVGAGVSVGLRR